MDAAAPFSCGSNLCKIFPNNLKIYLLFTYFMCKTVPSLNPFLIVKSIYNDFTKIFNPFLSFIASKCNSLKNFSVKILSNHLGIQVYQY